MRRAPLCRRAVPAYTHIQDPNMTVMTPAVIFAELETQWECRPRRQVAGIELET